MATLNYKKTLIYCGLCMAWLTLDHQAAHARQTSNACTDKAQMVLIEGGQFRMGDDTAYHEEGPVHRRDVPSFLLSSHEVSNAEFEEFVMTTNYITEAERGWDAKKHPWVPEQMRDPGSVVFVSPAKSVEMGFGKASPGQSWWRFVRGANWRHPQGPGSDLQGKAHHPVVHISVRDANAYARWRGMRLPSEVEWEYAAQKGRVKFHPKGSNPPPPNSANTWQGAFPHHNSKADGYEGTAPRGCFSANTLGLHDMLGNVWEWTSSQYYPRHRNQAPNTSGKDPRQAGVPVQVIKGGSFLCSKDHCARYRPAARQAQETTLGTSHIGMRLATDIKTAELKSSQ